MKLPADSGVDEHLSLLDLLNSSTACFWLKQTFHNKGSTVDQKGARQRTDPFEDFYEYTGTGLRKFPIPESRPSGFAQELDALGRQFAERLPGVLLQGTSIAAEGFAIARREAGALRERMVALQEELDWQCYGLYALLDEPPYTENPPDLKLGERGVRDCYGPSYGRRGDGNLLVQATRCHADHRDPRPLGRWRTVSWSSGGSS